MAATWRLAKGKTWNGKLREEHANHGKIVPIPPGMQKRFGKGTMLIPRPLDIDAMLRKIRKGKLITTGQVRASLADAAGVDHACPFTTGIFIRIVAEAAEEALREGRKRVTPAWRLVRDDGTLLDKYPGGPKAQAAKLRDEGFTLIPSRGKKPPRVKEFERVLT